MPFANETLAFLLPGLSREGEIPRNNASVGRAFKDLEEMVLKLDIPNENGKLSPVTEAGYYVTLVGTVDRCLEEAVLGICNTMSERHPEFFRAVVTVIHGNSEYGPVLRAVTVTPLVTEIDQYKDSL